MFETNYKNSLPGYTGHIPGKVETDVPLINREARKHIPGKLQAKIKPFNKQDMVVISLELRVRTFTDRHMERSAISQPLKQSSVESISQLMLSTTQHSSQSL